MDGWTYDKAMERFTVVRRAKRLVEQWHMLADAYYNNEITDRNLVTPTNYVLTEQEAHLPYSNLIPMAVRVWQAVVMGAPFAVEVMSAGSRDTDDLKRQASNGLTNAIKVLRTKPDNKEMMRNLSLQALLYNLTFLYDGWDTTEGINAPFYQVINWRDAYIDPSTTGSLNSHNGPSFVALRLWYTKDQISRMYGDAIAKTLKPGIVMPDYDSDYNQFMDQSELDKLKYRYHVVHWWGFDMSVDRITRSRYRKELEAQWGGIIAGNVLPARIDPHRIALEEGDKKFVETVNQQGEFSFDTEDKDFDIMEVVGAAVDAQLGALVAAYGRWRFIHRKFLENGIEGGEEERFPGGVYRVDFQEGLDEPIRGPEQSPYTHGQLPCSLSRRHEGTQSYWTKGIMSEALDYQRYIEWLERRRDTHLSFQATPFLAYREDKMPARYREPEKGETAFAMDAMQGFRTLPLRGTDAPMDQIIKFIQPGPVSGDVNMTLMDKKRALMELFGASEIMRGLGPGAEASGKHIQLKMQAAARPSTFMLQLLEDPLHHHYERLISNILQFADPQWLSLVCQAEEVEAIMQVKQIGDFKPIVKVNLGSGMPTEWVDRFQIYMQLVALGIMPPVELSEEMNLPIPSQETLAARSGAGAQGNETIGSVTGSVPNPQNLAGA